MCCRFANQLIFIVNATHWSDASKIALICEITVLIVKFVWVMYWYACICVFICLYRIAICWRFQFLWKPAHFKAHITTVQFGIKNLGVFIFHLNCLHSRARLCHIGLTSL